MSVNYYNYLPTFHFIEPNNLKGLINGDVVAQLAVKTGSTLLKEVGPVGQEYKVFENGHMCSISKDGIDIWEAGKPLFISFTDPLYTLDGLTDPKNYAPIVSYHDGSYGEFPRLVRLHPGDEWTSDIDYETDPLYATVKEELMKVVVKMDDSKVGGADDWFATKTFPDGTKSYHYMYIGY